MEKKEELNSGDCPSTRCHSKWNVSDGEATIGYAAQILSKYLNDISIDLARSLDLSGRGNDHRDCPHKMTHRETFKKIVDFKIMPNEIKSSPLTNCRMQHVLEEELQRNFKFY